MESDVDLLVVLGVFFGANTPKGTGGHEFFDTFAESILVEGLVFVFLKRCEERGGFCFFESLRGNLAQLVALTGFEGVGKSEGRFTIFPREGEGGVGVADATIFLGNGGADAADIFSGCGGVDNVIEHFNQRDRRRDG